MKKILLSIMMLAMAGGMMAVPAYQGWRTVTQPDGSQLTIRQMGDEIYHYWENDEGEVVVLDSDGYWKTDRGPMSPAELSARRAKSAKNNGPRRVGKTNLAPHGLLILANYSDAQFRSENTREELDSMMNATVYTYDGAYGSARKYFSDQSNGQYVPTFDVVGPVNLPHNRAYYGANDTQGNDVLPGDMIVEACKLADEQFDLDFTRYDNDGDGEVDFVYVIYAGEGEADGGAEETVWPHNWDISTTRYYGYCNYTKQQCRFDGKYINNYACSGELRGNTKIRNGIGTLCHEFGHVIGLPDFYDTDNQNNPSTPNSWDIMDYGSYNDNGRCPPNYSAWEKYFFGWAKPRILNKACEPHMGTGYDEFFQINEQQELSSATSTHTQYYIENRQKQGWDKGLNGHGMLVWKVNYDKKAWDDNNPNNDTSTPRYTIVAAYGSPKVDNKGYVPFPGTKTVRSFKPYSTQPVLNIEEENGEIRFTYIEKKSAFDYYVLTENANVDSEEGQVSRGETLTLSITPATGYAVESEEEIEVSSNWRKLQFGVDYLLVENTLSVEDVKEDLDIIIEAKYVGETTDLKHLSADANKVKKILEDGRLFIIRDGKKYGILGD